MKKYLITLLLLPVFSKAQTIHTFAGNGTNSYLGDGGQATNASISAPSGFVEDAVGNVYVGGYGNNTIRKINTSGIISTIAGNGTAGYGGDGGPATSAVLNGPTKMAMDRLGNIYFADKWNHRIRKISTTGIITTVAGTGIGGYSGDGIAATASRLYTPTGVAIDTFGNLFIADYSNSRIRKVDASGIITTYAGTGVAGNLGDGGQATDAQLNGCHGVVVDLTGNVFIADQVNNKIRKVNTSGIITTFAGTGSVGFSGDGGQATAATFNVTGGVFVDNNSNTVFVTDEYNYRIRAISPSGIVTTICGNGTPGFGGDGGPATAANINLSNEVMLDHLGHLFIGDNNNYRVRVMNVCMSYITAQPRNDTVVAGATARFSVTTTVPSPSFQWQEDPGSGFVNLANVWPYSGVTTDTLTISNTSPYLNATHYRCVISSGDYCTDTSSSAILIVRSSTSVSSLAGLSYEVYPNPANDEITVRLAGINSSGTLQVYNAIGQLVLTKNLTGALSLVNVAQLAPGMYLLKLDVDGKSARTKVIKN